MCIRDRTRHELRARLALRERIHSQLRRARPLVEPLRRPIDATGLIVDDRNPAVGERIDAVEAQAKCEPAQRERLLRLDIAHGKRGAAPLDREPGLQQHREPPAFAGADQQRQTSPPRRGQLGESAFDRSGDVRGERRRIER